MPINKDQTEIVEIIGNFIIKLGLAISAVVAFFLILNHMFAAKDMETRIFYGGVDGIWGFCIFQVFKHYFPAKD